MKKKIKQGKARNFLAVHAHNKTSAGPMNKKGRKKQQQCDNLRQRLQEALDLLNEMNETDE